MDNQEKRPRHYAAEIAKLNSEQEMREAFKKVPVQYRALVKEHLKTIFAWRSNKS